MFKFYRLKRKMRMITAMGALFMFVTPTLASCEFNDIFKIFDKIKGNDSDHNHEGSDSMEGVMYDDFQIHFMTLGNDKAGDSIYIKAGDNDIVIDAGSRQASSQTVESYIDKYCKDKKLEYVILTHGDEDHVSGFTDTTKQDGLLSYYSVDTIIDSGRTNKTTNVYKKYLEKRDSLVKNGTKYYTAGDCFENKNNASSQFKLSDNVTMDILYNYYYFNNSSDENNYSVSTMFTYTNNGVSKRFMLTGDLEKEGETKMAEFYDGTTSEKTLGEVDVFKAGHHGSKTSSNDVLLNIIKPKMCVVSCCCGTNEYTGITDNQFPTQAFISRISKWTDEVYVTSTFESFEIAKKQEGENVPGVVVGKEYIKTKGFKEMNGNIVVSCKNGESGVDLGLSCSNNTTKLKDTEWFNMKITIDGIERPMRVWA